MPGGNRKGPRGMGPLSGRHMGFCAGFPYPGFMSPGPGYGMARGIGYGRGFGRGMGFGRGRGWQGEGYGIYGDYPPPSFIEEDETTILENQAKELGEFLKQIEIRLDELKKASKHSDKN